jgi:hypothetical protein
LVEHVLGKDEVTGSIPVVSSTPAHIPDLIKAASITTRLFVRIPYCHPEVSKVCRHHQNSVAKNDVPNEHQGGEQLSAGVESFLRS